MEIDLFSGRPNPSFELDPQATGELIGLIATMKRSQLTAAPQDGLGFRGFIVSVEGHPQLHVSGPAVSSGSEQFVDESRTIEKFLLSRIPPEQKRQFQDVLPP